MVVATLLCDNTEEVMTGKGCEAILNEGDVWIDKRQKGKEERKLKEVESDKTRECSMRNINGTEGNWPYPIGVDALNDGWNNSR